MGQIEDKLKKLIINRYGSISAFAEIIDIPYTTLASIFQRGISNAKVTNITKITEALHIDTNQLVAGRIIADEQSAENQLPHTPLTYFDENEYTSEELEIITKFANYIKSQRSASADQPQKHAPEQIQNTDHN